MPDFRVFCSHVAADAAEILLSADESHHLVNVNRARAGDPVVAFDGVGSEWQCELTSPRKNGATLKVLSRKSANPLHYAITLAQALPKGPAMDAIVRKATEIGARRIVPLESERTQVHFEGDRCDKKVEKWQTAALEAAKQCGNAFVPQIDPVRRLPEYVSNTSDFDLKLVASLHPGAGSLKTILATFRRAHSRNPVNVLWLVGPEGDLTAAEMALLVQSGFEPVTLGPLVLRCDTAATYALSVLSYELQAE